MTTKPDEAETLLAALKSSFDVFDRGVPLKLNVHKDLRALDPRIDRDALSLAIGLHVRSEAYLRSIAQGGPRYDLDGATSGEVSPEHQQAAADMLSGERAVTPHKLVQIARRRLETIDMQTRIPKITLIVTDFEQHLALKTEGAKTVPVRLNTPSGTITANLNPKSFRKAQATFEAAGGDATVIVQGELNLQGRSLDAAGLTVQPRAKPA